MGSISRVEALRQRVQEAIIPDNRDVLLDEFQMAKLLGVSVMKLRADRTTGNGVPFRKIGGSIRYCRADIDTFIDTAIRFSTKD